MQKPTDMKLSKMLISSGVLGRGEVRHCSEWEFPARPQDSRSGLPVPLRRALVRRARHQRAPMGRTFLHLSSRLLGKLASN